MNIVALDLELNQRNHKPRIIEIGVCIANLEAREILVKRSFLVNPREPLEEHIIALTTITDEMLKDAPPLIEAYDEMYRFCTQFNVHPMAITWGAGDVEALKRELAGKEHPFLFGRRVVDVKTIVQAHQQALGRQTQGGLAKNLGRYGLKFEGTKHRAVDDAVNTMRLYLLLLDKLKNL